MTQSQRVGMDPVQEFEMSLISYFDEIRHYAKAEFSKLATENGHLRERIVELGTDLHHHRDHGGDHHDHGGGDHSEEVGADHAGDHRKKKKGMLETARNLAHQAADVAHAAADVAHGVHSDTHHADADDIKHSLQNLKVKEPYDVTNEYYDEGLAQQIAKAKWFDISTMAVVVVNGIWIAVDVDYNEGELAENPIWMIMDNLFCIYFTGELIVRFFAFAKKLHVFCDGWFMFDLVLVLMMVFETWAMPLYSLVASSEPGTGGNPQALRLLRLLRLSRMAKMMRSVPELMILIKGTVVGIRSVAITLLLLLGITFVFAIAMRTLTDGTEVGEENFTTVSESAYTLLVQGVIPDNGDLMTHLRLTKWYLMIAFFTYIFLAALTFMNMLIGILCDAVSGVSQDEKEEMDMRHMQDILKSQIQEESPDFADHKLVSRADFFRVMKNEEVWFALMGLEVDIPSLIDNSVAIFADDKTRNGLLHFQDFVDVILTYRATNASMIKVMFELRMLVYDRMAIIDRKLQSLSGTLNTAVSKDGAAFLPMPIPPIPAVEDLLVTSAEIKNTLSALNEKVTSPVATDLPVAKIACPVSVMAQMAETLAQMQAIHPNVFRKEALEHSQRDEAPHNDDAELWHDPDPVAENARAPLLQNMEVRNATRAIVAGALGVTPEERPVVEHTEAPAAAAPAAFKATSSYGVAAATIGKGSANVPEVQQGTESLQPKEQDLHPELQEVHEGQALLQAETHHRFEPQIRSPDPPPHNEGQALIPKTLPPQRTNEPIWHMQPVKEPPPEVIIPMAEGASQSASEASDRAVDTYHYSYFDQSVQRIGLKVCWDGELPWVQEVSEGGEAGQRGIMVRDLIVEINGIQTKGRNRDDLNPLFRGRPLTLTLVRKVISKFAEA